MDLELIFDSMLNSVTGIRTQCYRCCQEQCKKSLKCHCGGILDELDLHVQEIELHIKRAKVLRGRASSTAQLVSSLAVELVYAVI